MISLFEFCCTVGKFLLHRNDRPHSATFACFLHRSALKMNLQAYFLDLKNRYIPNPSITSRTQIQTENVPESLFTLLNVLTCKVALYHRYSFNVLIQIQTQIQFNHDDTISPLYMCSAFLFFSICTWWTTDFQHYCTNKLMDFLQTAGSCQNGLLGLEEKTWRKKYV